MDQTSQSRFEKLLERIILSPQRLAYGTGRTLPEDSPFRVTMLVYLRATLIFTALFLVRTSSRIPGLLTAWPRRQEGRGSILG